MLEFECLTCYGRVCDVMCWSWNALCVMFELVMYNVLGRSVYIYIISLKTQELLNFSEKIIKRIIKKNVKPIDDNKVICIIIYYCNVNFKT